MHPKFQQIADTATGISAAGFAITLADVDTLISIVAGVVAIIAGAAAAYYHIKKARALSNASKQKP